MLCVRCRRIRDSQYQSCSSCLHAQREYKKRNKEHIKIVNRAWKSEHWPKRIVSHSLDSDRKYNRVSSEMGKYITPQFLVRLRELQNNLCSFCGIEMQTFNRKLHDGLTVQRVDNTQPHVQSVCQLACHSCNCHRVEGGNENYLELKKGQVYLNELIQNGYQNCSDMRVPQIFI
jgi:hypothetical protein